MQKTEFTQQEWDAFGVNDLRMHHFVKSSDSYFRPAGTEALLDVRVLRPLRTMVTLATTAASSGAWAMWSWWARR